MDRWMDGRMDGQTDGRTDGWTEHPLKIKEVMNLKGLCMREFAGRKGEGANNGNFL